MFEVLFLCLLIGYFTDLAYRFYFSETGIAYRHKRAVRKLPKIERGAARFAHKYPKYEYGYGSYGVPMVDDFSQGAHLRIGSYCSIAHGVKILLGGHHRTDFVTTWPVGVYMPEAGKLNTYHFTRGGVDIGNDVWLCYGCTILSGVSVGNGAVISANAHVFKDVPPYAIVGGNPAKIIGWRFSEDVIQELLNIAWWDWPRAEIAAAGKWLCNDDIQAFLDYARQRPMRLDKA